MREQACPKTEDHSILVLKLMTVFAGWQTPKIQAFRLTEQRIELSRKMQ
jgi:hypothetical protein